MFYTIATIYLSPFHIRKEMDQERLLLIWKGKELSITETELLQPYCKSAELSTYRQVQGGRPTRHRGNSSTTMSAVRLQETPIKWHKLVKSVCSARDSG